MQVYLGYAGARGQSLAEALYGWLPCVIPGIDPWRSTATLGPTARWNPEVAKRLEQASFGLLCVTRDSLMAPWLLFEAGTLAKAVHNARVYTYLLDLTPAEVHGPLAQFKAILPEKEATWALTQAMCAALDIPTFSETQLHTIFDRFWPDLETSLRQIPRNTTPKTRSHRSLLEEILENVRGLSRMSYGLIEREQATPPSPTLAETNGMSAELLHVSPTPAQKEEELIVWMFDQESEETEPDDEDGDEIVGLEEVHKPPPLLAGLSKPRILVVEDNENTQFLIQSVLEDSVHITTVASAEEALLEAFRSEFEMVVVDINLGDGPNGMEVLSELRAMPMYRQVPIVAITAYALSGDKERFLKMGFSDYLAKPFHADDLLALMVRL